MGVTMGEVAGSVERLTQEWRDERTTRLARTRLERADFDLLRDADLLRIVAPVDAGGSWESMSSSLRELCGIYRQLGRVDPSVALVSAMHPAVVAFWLSTPDPTQPAWEEQRRAVFASALAGEQWGTITSEPGSGGDITRTRSVATPADGVAFIAGETYAVTGDKHFGSGSGITDRMITTALPDGQEEPSIFVLDVRDRPWDGTAGLQLIAEWDGMGMAATQSHAMRLESVPTVKMAYDGPLAVITRNAGPFVATIFTAVVLGVLDEAIAVAREQVRARAETLRPFEQVEWSRAEQDHWLAVQAYEGALRAVEQGTQEQALHGTLRAKQSVAELAEQTLLRLTRVLGGGTFSRRSPFAHWFEDVRALGFLRPPWGLAFDNLMATSIS
jgi:alkylation response protein AidB-like acyl-CoA dehydrogenase